MGVGRTLRRSALAATVLSLPASALAQGTDDRYPFLAPRAAAVASVPRAPAAVTSPLVAVPFPMPAPLRAAPATASVPLPRAAPARSVVRVPAAAETAGASKPSDEVAPVRVAYAAQSVDADSPFSWLIRHTAAEPPAESVPRPPAPILDKTAVPQLEPRYHVRRVPISPAELVVLVENKAIKHGVPLALAHAVVRVESNFDPRLTGPGTTIGLMQIKYPTAQAMGFTGSAQDLLDPGINLEWGMRYLARAHRLARGDVCGTVMRYQGGLQATQMSAAAIPYCGKVKTLMAMR
jgi:soluble lytic murein transglycosylase-like protein